VTVAVAVAVAASAEALGSAALVAYCAVSFPPMAHKGKGKEGFVERRRTVCGRWVRGQAAARASTLFDLCGSS
jgi:hypothetical protein